MPWASHDVNASIKCITWSKSYVAPQFDYLHLTNAVVPLMMPLVSHDADAGASGMTLPISHVACHFDHFDVTSAVMPLMTLLASCDIDTNINGITWTKKFHCKLFQLSWPNEYSGAIDNVIGITWCWYQCQQCQMSEKINVSPCFNHLDLTNRMISVTMPLASCDADTGAKSITQQ